MNRSEIDKLSSASWAIKWTKTMSKRFADMKKEALRVFGVSVQLIDAVEKLLKEKQ